MTTLWALMMLVQGSWMLAPDVYKSKEDCENSFMLAAHLYKKNFGIEVAEYECTAIGK